MDIMKELEQTRRKYKSSEAALDQAQNVLSAIRKMEMRIISPYNTPERTEIRELALVRLKQLFNRIIESSKL